MVGMRKIMAFSVLVLFATCGNCMSAEAQYVGNVSDGHIQELPIFHKVQVDKTSDGIEYGFYMALTVALATITTVVVISLVKIRKSK